VRRGVAGALATASLLALAACAPDPSITALEPTPIAASSTPSPGTVASSTSLPTPPTLPSDPEPLPTEPPAPTLPPIVEPEVYTEVPLAEVVDVGDAKVPREHDALLAVALVDIDAWLADELPAAFNIDWQPLEGGVWAGYPERAADLPGCGEDATTYDDLVLYAAFYCEFGDFMAYDDGDTDASVIVPLADDLGPAVLGVVLAHEYGHAVQQRTGVLERRLPTVYTEQQADCIAGAWVGRTYRGESPNLRLGDADLRAGLVAMVEVRDPVGVDQFEVGGHGTAFDRVGAFQYGFTGGLARCAGLIDEPLPLMPNEFQTVGDRTRGGSASYDCSDAQPGEECTPAPEFLAADLNHYWQDAVPDFPTLEAVAVDDFAGFTCPEQVLVSEAVAYCPQAATIAYDEPYVLDLYDEYGDFTLGYLYGIAWGAVQQERTGSTLTGEARQLQLDCWTGAWVADITPDEFGRTRRLEDRDGDGEPDSTVSSSPGDLDEAVRMAILLGDLGARVDRVGSPFEKIEHFRAGVLGGPDACT